MKNLNRMNKRRSLLRKIRVFQGGMGVAVSGWQLARAVSIRGLLGIVSGTGLAIVLSRRLQNGDKDGMIHLALEHFPIPEMGWRIWNKYYIEGGKDPSEPFKAIPVIGHRPTGDAIALLIVANFVEIWLAKRGHNGLIGVNYLEKLQDPHLYSLFGAILAGVDVVVVGAGLPTQFPGVIQRLSSFREATYNLSVVNGDLFPMKFDPCTVMDKRVFRKLKIQQPLFLGIVSTFLAAKILHTRSNGPVDGFVVEKPIAGGHNAPPRNKTLSELGEPVYDMEGKDNPRLEEIIGLGLPVWVAGGTGSREVLQVVRKLGAAGIQVGTQFSLALESGIPLETKQRRIKKIQAGTDVVRTDPRASPSGYPFKVVDLEGTVSEEAVYEGRTRICDLSYLREAYWMANGELGWRCPSEPVEDFVRKGGKEEETLGRKCICNHLLGLLQLGQIRRDGSTEPAIMTSGDDTSYFRSRKFCKKYGVPKAKRVIKDLLGTPK